MEKYRLRRDSMYRALAVAIGIFSSTLLSYAAFRLKLPIYPDALGTIAISAVGGLFPGIMTAVLTDTVCMLFNDNALYFGIVNVLTAIFTAWFIREKGFKYISNVIIFILSAGLIGGGLSGIIQWTLFGEPQSASIAELVDKTGIQSSIVRFLLFLFINISVNIIEKGVSTGIVLLVMYFIPNEILIRIRNSGWRQRPLSPDEVKEMDAYDTGVGLSIRRRMTIMLAVIALAVAVLMSYIGLGLYYRNAKEDVKNNAYDAAEAAAMVIDGDKIADFLKEGKDADGYKETADMLYYIWKGSTDVEYLYVLTIDEEYVTFVFDVYDETMESDEEPYAPGDKVEIEEEFKPYMPELLAGEEIEPVVSDNTWSYLLTVYYPIYDSNGNTVCYTGAGVSMNYLADYMKDFIFRVLLMLSAFFVLIVAYGLQTTGLYIVYPVESMVHEISKFTNGSSDQKQLDADVRSLRSLDISTGDEIEKLYRSVCKMAASQTEQIRSVRRLSENTAKMQDGLIITMADLVENRDSDTGAHIQKTAAYVKIIVEGLKKKGYYAEKITDKFMSDVVRSAPLHDVGKISIPDNVLNKPGKLTDEEYEIMKTHTTEGRKIMEKAIDTVEGENYLKEARNMAAYHHERWDGKGYPEGLHGEVIPLSARIMAVADVFDALTSPRVYKPPFPLEQALSMIQESAGTQFDAKCVEVFLDALPEVKVVLRKYNENAV